MDQHELCPGAQVIHRFCLDGEPISARPYGNGHINQTYLVTDSLSHRYILQRISPLLAPDPGALMENIGRILEYLREKKKDPRSVLSLVKTREGKTWTMMEAKAPQSLEAGKTKDALLETDGSREQAKRAAAGELEEGAFRVYRFVENSFCQERMEKESDCYKTAYAFGRFLEELSDFPASTLTETIVDFHNTPLRFSAFEKALKEDAYSRAKEVSREISFLLERKEKASLLQRLRERGELPVRVTHNDTKLNNILFDRESGEPLCVIDLDTVMPGLSLYDFGDIIRSGATDAAEDERNLDRVLLNLKRYGIFKEGFEKGCSGLTEREKELLPMGALVITTEQAVRFLTDYLMGDVYYHTSYPDHNLVRTRNQIRLVMEMESHWEELCAI